MFKNIQIFRVAPTWQADLASMEGALTSGRFVDCGASQERSIGWVEPRGEKHGALVESVGGQLILKLMFESKVIPGGVVAEAVAKRLEAIEASTGRIPGKKEKRELQEDVRNGLMVQAFTKKFATLVWIAPQERLLVVESGSQSRTDEVITQLVKALDGLVLTQIQTLQSPAASMAIWLDTQELPAGFTADRDCVLKANDESKSSVRYARHALDIDEIRAHIASGKTPAQLALTWEDRLSLVLTESGTVKKIEFLEVVFENQSKEGKDSGFDADVAIATGELLTFIPALIEALGGEALQPLATGADVNLSVVAKDTVGEGDKRIDGHHSAQPEELLV